jgi:hypothetical protein|tara:strand:- start:2321 stop:2566 length:246 start_codon:yes stop_codon:yes gene_type:complete
MGLLTLAIVGAAASGIVGFVKTKTGVKGYLAVLALVIVSLVGGLAFWLIKDANLLDKSIEILIAANLIYTLLYKQLKGLIK